MGGALGEGCLRRPVPERPGGLQATAHPPPLPPRRSRAASVPRTGEDQACPPQCTRPPAAALLRRARAHTEAVQGGAAAAAAAATVRRPPVVGCRCRCCRIAAAKPLRRSCCAGREALLPFFWWPVLRSARHSVPSSWPCKQLVSSRANATGVLFDRADQMAGRCRLIWPARLLTRAQAVPAPSVDLRAICRSLPAFRDTSTPCPSLRRTSPPAPSRSRSRS